MNFIIPVHHILTLLLDVHTGSCSHVVAAGNLPCGAQVSSSCCSVGKGCLEVGPTSYWLLKNMLLEFV